MASSSNTTTPSFWEDYSSEESFLPFYYPFCFWAASYLYCQVPRSTATDPATKKDTKPPLPWHEWHQLHNVHNVGAVILALISLWINDDSIFNERIVIMWNWSYFVVDLIDTATRADVPFVIHAVCCLGLGAFNYATPLCRELRMNSKACLLETSSPFLHLAKRTKNPIHFLLFALVFTLCRVVWIPIMMMQLRQHDMEWTDIRLVIVAGFYLLNLFWYSKIVQIIINGGDSSSKKAVNNKKVV